MQEPIELSDSDACVAKFSEDDQWYRAQVQSICEDFLVILFVDYGNTETTTRDKMQPLRQVFAQRPPFAVPCALYGIQPIVGGEYNPFLIIHNTNPI